MRLARIKRLCLDPFLPRGQKFGASEGRGASYICIYSNSRTEILKLRILNQISVMSLAVLQVVSRSYLQGRGGGGLPEHRDFSLRIFPSIYNRFAEIFEMDGVG